MLMLQKLPDTLPVYLKAAMTMRRKPGATPEIPTLAAHLPELRFDAAQIEAYRQVCGFVEGEDLPITYPQVVAMAMQMQLMVQPEFPLPMMGLVHLRNLIEQQRPLRADEPYAVTTTIEAGGRPTDKGLELDIVAEFQAEGATVYRAVMTILYRGAAPPAKGGKKQAPPPAPVGPLAQYAAFDAPADIGRRYGKVSGDRNPIHLSAASAKLFGFPKAIAHGMWSLARCASLIQGQLGQPPSSLSVSFKQPLLLPGKVAVKYHREGDALAFSLLSRSSSKVHLSGSLR